MTPNHQHTLQCSWGVSHSQSEIQQVWLRWLVLHVFQVLAGLQSLPPSNRDSGAGSVVKTSGWPMISIIISVKLKQVNCLCQGWYETNSKHWQLHNPWKTLSVMDSTFIDISVSTIYCLSCIQARFNKGFFYVNIRHHGDYGWTDNDTTLLVVGLVGVHCRFRLL